MPPKTKYLIFDRDVWFDFNGPKYLFGRYCIREFIWIESLKYGFKMYQN